MKRTASQVSIKMEPKSENFDTVSQSNELQDDNDYESSLNQSFDTSNTSKIDEMGDEFMEEEEHEHTPEENTSIKYIPKLNRSSSSSSPDAGNQTTLDPDNWTVDDVVQFLTLNDCTAHCDAFASSNVNGKRMLELTKDDIITLLGMKVGPALKIFDLIQQLKCRVNPKLMKNSLNKKFL